MKRPSCTEVWQGARAKLLNDPTHWETLERGGVVQVGCTPPVRLTREPSIPALDLHGQRYSFRLEWHQRAGEWWIDGTEPGMNGWVPIEGPIAGKSPVAYALDRLRAMLLEAMV
jgi:hypothetical protein